LIVRLSGGLSGSYQESAKMQVIKDKKSRDEIKSKFTNGSFYHTRPMFVPIRDDSVFEESEDEIDDTIVDQIEDQ
jgi:hypothetical protein